MGIRALVGAKKVEAGNLKLLEVVPGSENSGESFSAGESEIWVAIDGDRVARILVRDQERPEAHAALEELKKIGVSRILMATGDRKETANLIAEALGITEVHSELMPADKYQLIDDLKKTGRQVAMVGDGINDAQAFAHAHLSIAMGGGHCDVAIETADVTLGRNDLYLVPEALTISQKTLATIYQNFAASVGINFGGILFGAAGKLSPFSAAIVHNASTIAVVINSLRLGREVANGKSIIQLKEELS